MSRARRAVGDDIPDFLRAKKSDQKNRKRRNEEWAKAHPVENRVEMPSPKKGDYPAHWLEDKGTLRLLRDLEDQKEEKRLRREEKQREINPLKSMTPLKKILGWLKAEGKKVRRRHAIAAIEASKIIHKKLYFDDIYVQDAKRIVSEYVPPVKERKSRGPGVPRQSVDQTAVIVARVKTNPCRAGTGRHGRVALLLAHAGGTVAAYLAAGGALGTLLKSMEFGWVKVESQMNPLLKEKKK